MRWTVRICRTMYSSIASQNQATQICNGTVMGDIYLLLYLCGYFAGVFTYVYRNGGVGVAPLAGLLFPIYFYYLNNK